MIKNITVTNYLDQSITFELRHPEKSGFLVYDITGFGPSKADINYTDLSSTDGAVFNSSRVLSRNIVMSFLYISDEDIESVRQMSYKYFPVKKRVLITVETDNRTAMIYGYVESNVPVMFSKRQTAQISIVCPDPNFYSLYSDTMVFSGLFPAFEFPFGKDIPDQDWSEPFEFGQLVNLLESPVFYSGESDIGMLMTIKAKGPVENIFVSNYVTGEALQIDTARLASLTGSGIIDGDTLLISTVRGNKYVTLVRDDVEYNVLNALAKGSDWIRLVSGDNLISYSAESGQEYLQFRVDNQVIYEGL
jgi:hypothetical protein